MIKEDIFIIIGALVLAVMAPFVWKTYNLKLKPMARFIAFLPMGCAVFNLVTMGYEVSLLSFYIGSVLVAIVYFFDDVKKVSAICIAGLLIMGMAFPIALNYEKYRNEKYSDEFTKAVADMKEHYILKDYKEVDIDLLYEKYLPLFEEADGDKNDQKAYDLWCDFCAEIPDGHVYAIYNTMDEDKIKQYFAQYKTDRLGYDFGFFPVERADGEFVCAGVDENTDFYAKGGRNGLVLKTVNGMDISILVDQAVCHDNTCDVQNERMYKAFYAFADMDVNMEVCFLDQAGEKQKVSITGTENAYNRYKAVKNQYLHPVDTEYGSEYYKPNLNMEMLNEDTGYLVISDMDVEDGIYIAENLARKYGEFLTETYEGDDHKGIKQLANFQINRLKAEGAKRLIIDLRGNGGGLCSQSMAMASLFCDEPLFAYADGAVDEDGNLVKANEYFTSPQNVWGDGEIILLVNNETASAAEIFVNIMKQLPNVTVVGMTNTAGCGQGVIPAKYDLVSFSYPIIYTLEQDGSIMIDGDESGVSKLGIDVKVPMTEEAVEAIFVEKEDYLLDYVLGMK